MSRRSVLRSSLIEDVGVIMAQASQSPLPHQTPPQPQIHVFWAEPRWARPHCDGAHHGSYFPVIPTPERRITYSQFFHQGHRVCQCTIGIKRFKNIKSSYLNTGPVPRVHGNMGRRPKHQLSLEQVNQLYATHAHPHRRFDFEPVAMHLLTFTSTVQ